MESILAQKAHSGGSLHAIYGTKNDADRHSQFRHWVTYWYFSCVSDLPSLRDCIFCDGLYEHWWGTVCFWALHYCANIQATISLRYRLYHQKNYIAYLLPQRMRQCQFFLWTRKKYCLQTNDETSWAFQLQMLGSRLQVPPVRTERFQWHLHGHESNSSNSPTLFAK